MLHLTQQQQNTEHETCYIWIIRKIKQKIKTFLTQQQVYSTQNLIHKITHNEQNSTYKTQTNKQQEKFTKTHYDKNLKKHQLTH